MLLKDKYEKNIKTPALYHLQALFGKMPRVTICLGDINTHVVKNWYKIFNRKIPIITFTTNRRIAVSCLPIMNFANAEEYINTVKGKNSADYYRRKALKKGYTFILLNRNNYIDDMYEINTSAEFRQKKRMTEAYRKKIQNYIDEENNEYYGIIDMKGKLVAYAYIVYFLEAAYIYKIIGHKKNLDDGIMYLLGVSLISVMIEQMRSVRPDLKYALYDSFLTNTAGLALYKKRFGFKPYKIDWTVLKK